RPIIRSRLGNVFVNHLRRKTAIPFDENLTSRWPLFHRLSVLTVSCCSNTPSPLSVDKKTIPAASRARRTWSRVDSNTSSPLWDSRRLSAVNATWALSASVSCVHPSNARAARDWRAVIIHDHLPPGYARTPELRLLYSDQPTSERPVTLERTFYIL